MLSSADGRFRGTPGATPGPFVELRGEKGKVTLSWEDWPLLLVTAEGVLDPDLVLRWHRAYVDIVYARGERYVYVLDASAGGELPATSRRAITRFLKDYEGPEHLLTRLHLGSVYVLPSALLRGVATAIFWIQQPQYRWKFAATLTEAEQSATEWFAEKSIPWEGMKQR